jgi:hypothetical protein
MGHDKEANAIVVMMNERSKLPRCPSGDNCQAGTKSKGLDIPQMAGD